MFKKKPQKKSIRKWQRTPSLKSDAKRGRKKNTETNKQKWEHEQMLNTETKQ